MSASDDKRNSDIAAMVEVVCGLKNRVVSLEARVKKLEDAADLPGTPKQEQP